jgi:hypothetical protein
MKTKKQHNTPWNYAGFYDHCAVGKEYHEILDNDGFEVINENGIVTSRADAEFIVKAVNSHDKLLAFAKDIFEKSEWPQGGIDGEGLQEIAIKHGLLIPETRFEPCDAEGIICYHKAQFLID